MDTVVVPNGRRPTITLDAFERTVGFPFSGRCEHRGDASMSWIRVDPPFSVTRRVL